MTVLPEDLRAAVQSGLITEAQAANLTSLAEARRSALATTTPAEEPFVLFKGFNEIFIVVGLTILFAGWVAVAGILGADYFPPQGMATVLIGVVTLAGLVAAGKYFTLRRRMIAPSIALSVMVALAAWVTALALLTELGVTGLTGRVLTALLVTGILLAHYRMFRVPFSAALIACAAFYAIAPTVSGAGGEASLLMAMAGGRFYALSLAFGLAVFALAMWFDMRDPHRVTTRAATGFWLHVVAAPMIVNPVAVNLLERDGTGAQLVLLVFLTILALIAIVIDRRSFLVSGAAYAVAIAFTLFDGSALVILFLGLGLVLLGSNWERMRSALMRALPDFPGKHRLPPYGSTT